MEFKLNEYHQGVTDDEILDDVKKVARDYGDKYLSISAYRAKGKYSESTIRNRFGSWSNLQNKLGLRTSRNTLEMKRISDVDLIADLQRVAALIGSRKVTSTQYCENGKYSFPTIIERFGAWSTFVEKSGLEQTDFIKPITNEELFEELEKIWISLGKQPTTTDMKKGISEYSLDTYMKRFGGWRNALIAFLKYIDSDEVETVNEEDNQVNNQENMEIEVDTIQNEIIEPHRKRTTRNISAKLRLKVFIRDDFKCCFCGASPAKDPNIELHIDHIIPWSKGGETIFDNLQTLCSKCNLGKSNELLSNVVDEKIL